jgi:hypothetical protein
MIYPSMPQSCLENLTECHDFLVHSVARWRLATHSSAFFKPMDAVLIDLACRDLRKHHAPEKWDQVTICTCMLSASIGLATLSLRDDVELT